MPRLSMGLIGLSVLLLLDKPVQGQRRNENVIVAGSFGVQLGTHISFAAGEPADMGQLAPQNSECTAVISDTSGNFLFTTANGTVYDRYGAVMDQGDLMMGIGNGDVTQGGLIFPRPGMGNRYEALFIRDTPYSAPMVQGSCASIDMDLNGGLGGVIDSRIFGQAFTEKLTGAPHANGVDYWAVMHEWGSNAFRSYVIDQDGLDTVPVLSYAGSPHTAAYGPCPDHMNFQGEMKVSYSGDELALCNSNTSCDSALGAAIPSIVQLFHFDDATGLVTYWLDLPGHRYSYGLEFSQDGSKLYVSGADSVVHYVDQYDLSADDTITIAASRYRVLSAPYGNINDYRPSAMELAPDGRIYVGHLPSSRDAILHPDLPGAQCGYTEAFFPLSHPHHFSFHWNQLKRYHDSEYKRDDTGLDSRTAPPVLSVWPNPAVDQAWLRLPASITSVGLQLRDATGRLVRDFGRPTPGTQAIDVSGLAGGLYFVALTDGVHTIGQARLLLH